METYIKVIKERFRRTWAKVWKDVAGLDHIEISRGMIYYKFLLNIHFIRLDLNRISKDVQPEWTAMVHGNMVSFQVINRRDVLSWPLYTPLFHKIWIPCHYGMLRAKGWVCLLSSSAILLADCASTQPGFIHSNILHEIRFWALIKCFWPLLFNCMQGLS